MSSKTRTYNQRDIMERYAWPDQHRSEAMALWGGLSTFMGRCDVYGDDALFTLLKKLVAAQRDADDELEKRFLHAAFEFVADSMKDADGYPCAHGDDP